MKKLAIYTRFYSIRLIVAFLLFIIPSAGYFLTLPAVTAWDLTIHNPVFAYVQALPVWLYVVNYFILIFAGAILLIMSLITFYTIKTRQKERIDRKFREVHLGKIFKYIFAPRELNDKQKEMLLSTLKKALKSDYAIRLFLTSLLRIQDEAAGIISQQIKEILKGFNYNYLVKAYLHSPYLRHKLFALKIISNFQIPGFDQKVLKFTKSKNSELRVEACLTLLKLGIYEDLSFLYYSQTKLSTWDINMIIKTLQELDINDINYIKLLQSDIAEINTLGIMLANVHNRRNLKPLIKQKLGYPDSMVNEEAFLTFIAFTEEQEDYDVLIDKFEAATDKAQLQIIQALQKAPDTEATVKFLTWIVETKSYTHKVEALRLLLMLNWNVLSKYRKSENEAIRQSCLEALDINN